MSRRVRGPALPGARRGDRAGGAAARRRRARAAARRRARASPSRSACCSSRGWCGSAAASTSSRTRPARRSWRSPSCCRRSAGLRAGGSRRGAAAVSAGGARRARAEPPRPTRAPGLLIGAELVFVVTFCAMALLVAYSPDVWNTEKPMDMALRQRARPEPLVPAARPVDGRRGPQLLLPRPPGDGDPRAPHRRRAQPRLQRRARRCCSRSPRRRCSRSPARCGRRCAGRARQLRALAGARRAASAVVAVLVLGNLARRARAAPDGRPAARLRLVRAVARRRRARSTSSRGSRSCSATCTRTCSRCRSRCWRSAFAVQVALGGPRARPRLRASAGDARRAALAIGDALRDQLVVVSGDGGLFAGAVVVWLRDGEAGGRELRAVRWGAARARAERRCWCCRSTSSFDPAADGVGLVSDRAPVRRFVSRPGAALRAVRGARWRSPTRAGSRAQRQAAGATLVWLARAAVVGGSLLASLDDLAGAWRARRSRSRSRSHAALAPPPDRRRARRCGCSSPAACVCVLVPELVYVRDAFDGATLERMNTVFKLGYQAWLLLGARRHAGAVRGERVGCRAGCGWRWRIALVPLVAAGARLPLGGDLRAQGRLRRLAHARRAALAADERARRRRGDRLAARQRAGRRGGARGRRPRLLARSATRASRPSPGWPTVIGWAGHEVQWQHDPGDRCRQVAAAYSATDPQAARGAASTRYGVDYVVVGPLERTDVRRRRRAPSGTRSGRRVFDRDGTIVWAVRQAPGALVEPLGHAARRVPHFAA